VHLTATQDAAGPVPGRVKLTIKLEHVLGLQRVGTSSGTAEGALFEDTLRFSETFSQPGTTTNWVAVHEWVPQPGGIERKLQVSLGAFRGVLDHLQADIPSPVHS
jgi:hypothetical protein